MTAPHDELLDYLQNAQQTSAARARFLRSAQQLVMEYGWWYNPIECPEYIQKGIIQNCHKNAIGLTQAHSSFTYCEGYALFKSGLPPTIHAWVTNGKGDVIDNTWHQVGIAYAGIPFKSLFVSLATLKSNAFVSLLDDYTNDWPLLGELGNRPDEWLEADGQGIASVTPSSQ